MPKQNSSIYTREKIILQQNQELTDDKNADTTLCLSVYKKGSPKLS